MFVPCVCVCEVFNTPCSSSSWYLYMHDKLTVSGTALDSARAADEDDDTLRSETLKPVRKAPEEAEEGERKASAGLTPPRCLRAKRHDRVSNTTYSSNTAVL